MLKRCKTCRWLSWPMIALVLLAGFLGWQGSRHSAAQKDHGAPKDYKDMLPRIPPCPPAEALQTFQTLPGFHIEQVAAEPLVADPIAMAFDENGRLYVVEMCDYSEQDKDFLGRIRLLEDTDGDGRFDKSTIFADKLSWPTAVICYDGGVFIGAPPHIYYCKDTDGDGQADIRKLVYTGFSRQNVQGMLNTFWWGLDNRIHVATSSNGGQVSRADDPKAKAVNLGGRNLAFDPRSLEMALLSGAAQHGMSYDDWGRRFVCSNSDHIQLVLYEDHYLARNPYLAGPNPRVSIAVEGPQADVYRISPVEPWRELRTKLRVAGAVKGPIEGGGRAAGYFTGSTGLTIYRGDAWPAPYRGQAFVGDVGSNIVHRKVLEPDGVSLRARRVDDKKEFVASKDIWFRPCQFANAPDGTLYIADMYREVIEHPASLPPEIKKHLDLTSGRDRGRIYRIVPEGFKQRPLPRLGQATTAELVATLAHRNGWHRDTAARLLYQRQDRAARQPLEHLIKDGKLPEGRMHALHALHGLGLLTKEIVLQGLADPHPRVREHAIALSETVAPTAPAVQARLYELAADEDLRLRYQLAFSLGELPSGPSRNAALAKIVRHDAGDRWVGVAILSSVVEGAADLLADLAADKQFRGTASGQAFLAQLTLLLGTQARPSDVAVVLRHLEGLPAAEKALAAAMLRRLTEGLARSGSPLRQQLIGGSAKAQKLVAELVKSARHTASNDKRPEKERAEAVRTLRLASFADVRDVLEDLLAGTQPQPLQLAAVDTLSKFGDADAGAILIAAWPGFSPRLRTVAADSLFSRTDWVRRLLDAVDQKQVAVTDLDPARLKLLQTHADAKVRASATRLVGLLKLGRRQDVLDAYKNVLMLKGDSGRGKLVFQKVCAACHRLEGFGQEIGPNLAVMQNRGPETILLNVLDPNREVNPQYVNYLVVTKDGRSFTGMIAAETATSVTLKRAENQTDTILRLNIEQLRSTGLSIMPEGMEQQIDRQAMADLLVYLLAVK